MRKISNCAFSICRRLGTHRKFPLDPDHANEIPVLQYVVSEHKRNRVYAWGNAKTGALGIIKHKQNENKHFVDFVKSPKRLHFAEKNEVTSAACGFGFTLYAVDSPEHKIFGTGLNTDSQIGYHEFRKDAPLGMLVIPQPVNLPFRSEKSKVTKISAGRAHFAALTDEGLLLMGNNAYGQCGREIVPDEDYSRSRFVNQLESLDGKRIVDVECGQDHTMVILEDGSVYSCGWGADGQTGLGHFNVQATFSRVGGDVECEKITKLSCRSDFVLALNDKGEVFGWGNTEYSQITTSDNLQQVCNPVHIKMLDRLGKVKDVAAGGSLCAVLNDEGNVHVWGFGLLGTGPEVVQSQTPILIPPTLFGRNEFNPDGRVVSVCSGLGHLAAVTNGGDLYTWGRNREACLGLGHLKDQYFPLKVAIGAFVVKAYCGLDHTVVLCKSYLSNKS